MFNYPNHKLIDLPILPLTAEQVCFNCKEWFPIPEEEMKQMQKEMRDSNSTTHEVRSTDCTHCGESNIVVMVGKYDNPQAKSKRSCGVQFYTWPK